MRCLGAFREYLVTAGRYCTSTAQSLAERLAGRVASWPGVPTFSANNSASPACRVICEPILVLIAPRVEAEIGPNEAHLGEFRVDFGYR